MAHDYSQTGVFSSFGYEQHGRFRAAIARYSEFFVETQGNTISVETVQEVNESLPVNKTPNLENFAYEKDLQSALCSHISELFPEYSIFGGLGIGVEYSIGGKRIDVLLEHEVTKDLLAVELKSGMADFRVFGQISMYLGLLNNQFPERNISGVIIAGKIDESLIHACSITDKVILKTYRMSLELEDI